MRHVSFVSSIVVCVASLLLLASVAQAQSLQDVTTWHNDINRTGWQQNESILTPSAVETCTQANPPCFGLLWQYTGTAQNPMGPVYAQPLAVGSLSGVNGCTGTCSLVLIADEFDNIWAFNAASNTLVWTVNLANQVPGGSAVYCPSVPTQITFAPCEPPNYLGNNIGITGTPVIDTNAKILHAVAPIYDNMGGIIDYDLFAVDILTAAVTYVTMRGSMPGNNAGANGRCYSTYPSSGTLSFNTDHIQRSALLLLGGSVYVAFAPSDSEWESGWILGYSYTAGGGFQPGPVFSPTPYGTGGGIWGSGAGPASDGTYIYVATGNGTWDVIYTHPADVDFGDSILQLNPIAVNNVLPINDYYTPSNVLSYSGDSGQGLCINDEDVGSGGVMVFPSDYSYNGADLLVGADKQSNLYFESVAGLGKFNASGGNNVETYLTPNSANNSKYPQPGQGYWGSPAYWEYADNKGQPHYLLYYAVTSEPGPNCEYCANAPYPIYQYALATTGSYGPIPSSVNSAAVPTPTLFCILSPTPSVSSNRTTADSGILWAVETQNTGNPTNCKGSKGPAALHAFDATTMNQLYTSSSVATPIGFQPAFSTPTVFQGRVYMGTSTEVDVFGCTGPGGVCPGQ